METVEALVCGARKWIQPRGTLIQDGKATRPVDEPSDVSMLTMRSKSMSPALPNRVQDVCEEVSLESPHEVRYWTNRFEVSAAQVAHAVAAVGNSAACVDAWLRESRSSGVVRQDGKWTFLQSAVRNLMFFATGLTGGVMLT